LERLEGERRRPAEETDGRDAAPRGHDGGHARVAGDPDQGAPLEGQAESEDRRELTRPPGRARPRGRRAPDDRDGGEARDEIAEGPSSAGVRSRARAMPPAAITRRLATRCAARTMKLRRVRPRSPSASAGVIDLRVRSRSREGSAARTPGPSESAPRTHGPPPARPRRA